ncbi:hypothetical protein F4814DRAFT_460401 [Daldinia grandis]|nr:hypothetical protein F4814DRAFT_460401 [Daldinia grandis]
MAPTPSTSKSDKSSSKRPRPCSTMDDPDAIKRIKRDHQQKRLARIYRDKPNGTRLGMHWDFIREKNVPFIKSHMTGAIRPAILKDDMYDIMSKEELERHCELRQRMVEGLSRKQGKEGNNS